MMLTHRSKYLIVVAFESTKACKKVVSSLSVYTSTVGAAHVRL